MLLVEKMTTVEESLRVSEYLYGYNHPVFVGGPKSISIMAFQMQNNTVIGKLLRLLELWVFNSAEDLDGED